MIKFDGFLTLYQEDQDDARRRTTTSKRLPAMTQGEALGEARDRRDQHFTEPPPRYSEASLVKRMEELGIGRPSTYASILQVLKDRGYVRIDKKRLIPEDKGRVVTAFLEKLLRPLRRIRFHRRPRGAARPHLQQRDRLARLLRDFWRDFIGAVGDIKELRVAQVIDALDEMLGAASVPAARGRRRSAQVPELRQRPALAEARQVRRLHRLHQLSGMPLHPPVLDRQWRRQTAA